MIKYQVSISPESEKDYESIIRYILTEFGDISAAINIGRKIQARINGLETFPKAATIREEPELYKRGIRTLKVDNYSILYRVDDSTQKVEIIRITYGRRDLNSLF
ncbi:type II toxin-antitoxin system RelE/ParE family toxin [Candidatus Saccharibacteria bacterium]|nr:type II toxin-antitoxin system RelE/ParE family toxin [Candidatus Saccharibacteria bacterium]